MAAGPRLLRYAAFTLDPAGGNPAGVVLDAAAMDEPARRRLAAEVGYSETAFLTPTPDPSRFEVRYFSPQDEVTFCGHATIAAAVALAERDGTGRVSFDTRAGEVVVDTVADAEAGGAIAATLTSVEPRVQEAATSDVDEVLAALGWSEDDLDPRLPPRLGYAGAWHLVLAAGSRQRLAALAYDFDRLGRLMADRTWTTVHLVWQESDDTFHARDPFPPGGVVEDPATGAAAAAFGAYLRSLGLVDPPARVTVLQGEDLGRPSRLTVDVPPGNAPLRVSGNAVPIPPRLQVIVSG